MPPAHFYGVLVLRADHVQAALLFALLALVYALEDNVGEFRLVYCYHLQVEVVCRASYYSWEGLLADFTLEFSEIVGNYHSRNLFLDLAIDPHLQTLHMNALAGALALTG